MCHSLTANNLIHVYLQIVPDIDAEKYNPDRLRFLRNCNLKKTQMKFQTSEIPNIRPTKLEILRPIPFILKLM